MSGVRSKQKITKSSVLNFPDRSCDSSFPLYLVMMAINGKGICNKTTVCMVWTTDLEAVSLSIGRN